MCHAGTAGGPLHDDPGRLGLRLEFCAPPPPPRSRSSEEQHLVTGCDSGDVRPTAPVNSVRAGMTHGLEAAIVEREAGEKVKRGGRTLGRERSVLCPHERCLPGRVTAGTMT